MLVVTALLAMILHLTSAEPITHYDYITNYEVTRFGEIIWFWSLDTIWGPLRSNDYIGMKYSPHFFGPVYTSKDRFLYYAPDRIFFNYPPHFNCPPFPFPESYPHLIELADPIIESDSGRLMTRVVMRGDEGIDVFQYPLGRGSSPEPGDEEGDPVMHLDPPEWQVIYIDGLSEVYGELVGKLTIYSSGNMYMVDNIYYEGADPRDGRFDEDDMEHILGLVSDRNIIIRDNERNGRGDGFRNYGPQSMDHHSITINGSLVALGESITFEHQNDEWEAYQGTWSDERGIIHHKGGRAQYRRDYLHRPNHGPPRGTGYGKDWMYDHRLLTTGPPGFDPDSYPQVTGRYERLDLARGPYHFRRAIIGKLIVHAGVEINLHGSDALWVTDSLLVLGTEDEPVVFRTVEVDDHAILRVDWGDHPKVNVEHGEFSSTITVRFYGDSLSIEQSLFNAPVCFQGDVRLSENVFTSTVELTCNGNALVEKNVFKDGLKWKGYAQDGRLYNNTIAHSRRTGLELNDFRSLEVINNIIAFNRKGIDNRNDEAPFMSYNDVYANRDGDYVHCEPGGGSISADPRFNDPDGADYHLAWGSPCIDAGNPGFRLDPDGSRIEMGAFYFDRNLSVGREPECVKGFSLCVAPNPFNRRTVLNIRSEADGLAYIDIYNLRGRKVFEDVQRVSAGDNRIALDGRKFGAAGIYLAQVMASGRKQVVKLVYIP